jgi:uncharacterized membrane protein
MGRSRLEAFSGGVIAILQQTIIAAEGASSMLKSAVGKDWKGKLSPVLYLAAIASTLWTQWIALSIYAAVAAIWLVPDRRIERNVVH